MDKLGDELVLCDNITKPSFIEKIGWGKISGYGICATIGKSKSGELIKDWHMDFGVGIAKD